MASDFSILVPCVEELEITLITVVLTSAGDQGETVHANFNWDNGTTVSPIDDILVNFAATSPSYYNSQTGARGAGIFPYDGVNLTLGTQKIGTDDFDFNTSGNTLNWLSSTTLYTNSSSDINLLINAMASITPISNPSTGVYEATVSAASISTSNQYLYIVWDLRDFFSADLCDNTFSAVAACCDCVETCDSFTATKSHGSSIAACNDPSVNIVYKTNRTQPADLQAGDRVFTSECSPSYWLSSGWYKVEHVSGGTYYAIFVGANGIITSISSC